MQEFAIVGFCKGSLLTDSHVKFICLRANERGTKNVFIEPLPCPRHRR